MKKYRKIAQTKCDTNVENLQDNIALTWHKEKVIKTFSRLPFSKNIAIAMNCCSGRMSKMGARHFSRYWSTQYSVDDAHKMR